MGQPLVNILFEIQIDAHVFYIASGLGVFPVRSRPVHAFTNLQISGKWTQFVPPITDSNQSELLLLDLHVIVCVNIRIQNSAVTS